MIESYDFLKDMNCLVTGAGGFIGGHLVKFLLDKGAVVQAVDIKPESKWWQIHYYANNWYKMPVTQFCTKHDDLVEQQDVIFHLAADMGGLGYITYNNVNCMRSAVNTSILLDTMQESQTLFFSSSAVVYPESLQTESEVTALSEDMAYPAEPSEGGYGWEKLFSEQLCKYHALERGIITRVARFHNVYGPFGSWNDGREKAPAAMCRKVAEVAFNRSDTVEIWGDGKQTRSFMFIDDCIKGILDVTFGEYENPVNLGSSELVTINELMGYAADAAGIEGFQVEYLRDKPQGVRGRNSDNTLFHDLYGWEPSTSLDRGIRITYNWIYNQMKYEQLTYF